METTDTLLTSIGPGLAVVRNAPVPAQRRTDLALRLGRKGAGLALLPPAWTPPFCVIEASVYGSWEASSAADQSSLLIRIAREAEAETQRWAGEWHRGVTVRSSSTEETLNERGSNHSVELAADFDAAMLARAVAQVYEHYRQHGSSGSMAIIIQARVAHIALGHLSNEQRVSKTINHWMWEPEPADTTGGRFNSQREVPPNQAMPLRTEAGNAQALIRIFRRVARWCTELGEGRTHLEWGASADTLWLFQLDFENDQPDVGVDPTSFLRAGDFRPPGVLSRSSPFQLAGLSGGTGWPKIDKVASLVPDHGGGYPTLIFITGADFLRWRAAGYDLASDLDIFGHGRIVCRTDCRSPIRGNLNLPRTHTVGSVTAIDFMVSTLATFSTTGVDASDVCFILHKFIPSVTAAWAVARRGEKIVRVDSLWGLPDGLQYLPHDSFEVDVRRAQQVAENPRYKHAFLQETVDGTWEVVRVARKATRWRSLPSPDLMEIAARTQQIAEHLGRDIQIMWFCQVPHETGLARNIAWFAMDPAKQVASQRVSPGKRRFPIKSMEDLRLAEDLPKSLYLLQVDPDDPELFRSDAFIERLIEVANRQHYPVGLTGSILGHAFYLLEKAGISVVALNEITRSRTRQRRVFRKLVRDDIPERISEGGEIVTLAEIAKGEARAALVAKLYEESHELLGADTPTDVTAELADMLEVIRSLAGATGVDWSDVEGTANEKRLKRGSFGRNVVLLETSVPGWLARERKSPTFTIPLRSLSQIALSGDTATVPFSLLLSSGPTPTIRLPNGIELEVRMTGGGLQIAPASGPAPEEEQMSLPF